MRQFKNILLACGWEESKNSPLIRVASLVKENGAKLTAVCTVEPIPEDKRIRISKKAPMDLQEFVLKNSQLYLKDFLHPVEQSGVQVQTDVLVGKPHVEIIKKVLKDRHDLVIIPAHFQKKSSEQRLLHATTIKLLRHCPCPVWVMRPSSGETYKKILAAVDPNELDYENEQLNMKIMDIVISMAQMEQSEIHVVHAWSFYGEKALQMDFGSSKSRFHYHGVAPWISAEQLNAIATDIEKGHQENLDRLLKRFDLKGLDVKVHLIKGEAGNLIPPLVAKEKIELVVMGTHSRHGVAGFFIGNTSEKIMHHVECSVITVKPDQFVAVVA
jgi:nucleotide-binding universal stress UspA family protein